MSDREVEITRTGAGGKYQKQDAFSQLLQPLLGALIYAALIFFYVGALYFEAVLVGRAFCIIVFLFAVGLCVRIEINSGISARWSPLIRRRIQYIVALAIVAGLFAYLQWVIWWPWRFAVGGGRLWVTMPRRSFSVSVWLEAVRWLTVGALPFALLPAGRELLKRLLMDIFAPNLADNIRTSPGHLKDRRWIDYTNTEEGAEIEEHAPPPTWS